MRVLADPHKGALTQIFEEYAPDKPPRSSNTSSSRSTTSSVPFAVRLADSAPGDRKYVGNCASRSVATALPPPASSTTGRARYIRENY